MIAAATMMVSVGFMCNQPVPVAASVAVIDYTNMQKYVYENGDAVYGSIDETGLNGYGMAVYANGDCYEGLFDDGVRNYWGVYTFDNGDVLIGRDVDGVTEGMAVYIYNNHSILIGYYDNGELNGDGLILDTESEELYLGKWEDGEAVENVEYDTWRIDDNEICMGTKINGKLEDLGCLVNVESGGFHIGEFDNGLPNGVGFRMFADGTWEIGDYQDGELDGYFVYFTEDGHKLVGYQVDGQYYQGALAYYRKNEAMVVTDEEGNTIGSIMRS